MTEPAGTSTAAPSEGQGRMAVVDGIEGLQRSLGRLFVVVGVFDGLHLGHEYLLRELTRAARLRDARPAVITFDHHPDEILTGKAPPLLCAPRERLQRLEAAGVAVTVVQTFDVALRETPYETFVRRILDRVELSGFLMTPESAFGFQREGTPDNVAALGRELGYDVVLVPQHTLGGEPIRSTDIRSAIAAGDLSTAERLLGRPFTMTGTSVPSDRDATRLAFELPLVLPPPGAYRVTTTVGTTSESGRLVVEADRVEIVPALAVPPGTTMAVALAPSRSGA